MKTAIVSRFWREPKPSCNWCPRLVQVFVPGEKAGDDLHLTIPGGEDMTLEQIAKYLKDTCFVEVTRVVQPLSEIELTKKQFKALRGN